MVAGASASWLSRLAAGIGVVVCLAVSLSQEGAEIEGDVYSLSGRVEAGPPPLQQRSQPTLPRTWTTCTSYQQPNNKRRSSSSSLCTTGPETPSSRCAQHPTDPLKLIDGIERLEHVPQDCRTRVTVQVCFKGRATTWAAAYDQLQASTSPVLRRRRGHPLQI